MPSPNNKNYEATAILDSAISEDGLLTLSWRNNGVFVVSINEYDSFIYQELARLTTSGYTTDCGFWHQLASKKTQGISITVGAATMAKESYIRSVLEHLFRYSTNRQVVQYLHQSIELLEDTWGY